MSNRITVDEWPNAKMKLTSRRKTVLDRSREQLKCESGSRSRNERKKNNCLESGVTIINNRPLVFVLIKTKLIFGPNILKWNRCNALDFTQMVVQTASSKSNTICTTFFWIFSFFPFFFCKTIESVSICTQCALFQIVSGHLELVWTKKRKRAKRLRVWENDTNPCEF